MDTDSLWRAMALTLYCCSSRPTSTCVEFDLIGDADVAKFEQVYGAVISKDAMDKLKGLRGRLGPV